MTQDTPDPLLNELSIRTHSQQVETLEIDKDTPDQWVERDARLVRLTGKHPLNAEAPLSLLFDAGFFTPTSLFFVRNHGAVPKIQGREADEWTVSIQGLVDHPVDLSIADLKDRFKIVTLPATLVCAGNRRKEQNVVRKGLGFNWGAAGVSTALWTGIYLADLLEYVKPSSKAAHVVFEGADDLPNGPYGTSQPLSLAKDRKNGMLICWAMNGKVLEPDHGFPLRLIVPGKIGGRSVKWLRKIEISDRESQHYLHFMDNKVLPTQVGPEQARSEDHWWYDPKYLIQDLNVNSAISYPAHDEILQITDPGGTYAIQGYAYSGGGRRVTRVEVSLDEGDTWFLAGIQYPEDSYRSKTYRDTIFGTLSLSELECFCWCFWTYTTNVRDLSRSHAIQVRAMDEGLGLQPRDMYWNATSMMNNWWFRVAIHAIDQSTLRFEHPTLPGTATGGWMQRMKSEGGDILKPVFNIQGTGKVYDAEEKVILTKPDVHREITPQELHQQVDPWFIIFGNVYDASEYLKDHPGGASSITGMAGLDATEDFMAIHSTTAQKQLAQYHIGTLRSDSSPAIRALPLDSDEKTFLEGFRWKPATLVSVSKVSHDCRLYRFAFPDKSQALGLPTGQHVFLRVRQAGGTLVQRAYTPVSVSDAIGFVEFLVKLYLKHTDQYPEGGKMSSCLNNLHIDDVVEIKGPLGDFTWKGRDVISWRGNERRLKSIGMVCGGSGITPMIQTLRGVFSDPDSRIKVWLLDANKTEADIICRKELDTMALDYPERFKLWYTLSESVPDGWKYSTGRVSRVLLENHLPSVKSESLVLLCGPEGMIKACQEALSCLGWDPESQVLVL